jgi:predicted RND superfamily exporter protein
MTKRRAVVTLIILFIFTIIFAFFASKAKVDYEFENFFPASSSEVNFFENYRERFETDNDFLMLGIKEDNGVIDTAFLKEIKILIFDLKKLNNVRSVLGGTSLRRIKKEPLTGNLIPGKLLRISNPKYLEKDAEKVLKDPMLTPVFFSSDAKNINLIIKHKERLSKKGCDSLVADVEETLKRYNFQEYHMVGRAVAQSFYVNLMTTELVKFSAIGALLVIIFLFMTYRNFWSVFIPLLLVGVSAIWTIGLMTIFNKPLDIMLVVLPTLIFIVGISDVVHLYTKFLFLKREGMAKMKAINKTMKDVGIATLLTSLTTSIGFASLYFVQVPIIQEFGLVSALGVLVTFLVTYTAFMSFLTLSPERFFSKVVQSYFWKNRLNNAFLYTIRNGKHLLVYTGIFLLISFIGLNQIDQKNKLMEELPNESPLLEEVEYFNSTFVGMRPFEMALKLNEPADLFDYETLLKIDKLDRFLLDKYGVKYLISPSMMIKKINLDLHNGDLSYFVIPNENELKSITRSFDKKRFAREIKPFIDRREDIARICGRVEDYGSEFFKEKDALLSDFMKDSGFINYFDLTLTGSAYLIDKSNEVLTSNLLLGLLAAFGLIAFLVGFIFKSFKMVLVVLFVNVVPLIGIAGLMGFMGIDLKISTSVIFTIAFGIAVDDTIHFMSKYRFATKQHTSIIYALKNTYLSTGRAIILTTFILIGGFISLLFSGFMGTYYIGLFVSGTLLLALLIDLFILPFLLYLISKK